MLRNTEAVAILGEASFISNRKNEKRLSLFNQLRREAEDYFLGILFYLQKGIPKVVEHYPDGITIGNACPQIKARIIGGPEGEAIDPADDPSILVLTAKTQAMLHLKDGEKISKKIMAHGHSADSHHFDGRIQWIVEKGKGYSSLNEIINWLINNRPSEPITQKIVHGDFHPMNLLVKDGKVAAILDWSGFMVGDPMYGLGWTKALFVATGKHELPEDVFNQLLQMYIDSYASIHPIDYPKMDYYVIYRLVRAIIEGKEGQEVWTRPDIVNNIIKEIKEMTDIQIRI